MGAHGTAIGRIIVILGQRAAQGQTIPRVDQRLPPVDHLVPAVIAERRQLFAQTCRVGQDVVIGLRQIFGARGNRCRNLDPGRGFHRVPERRRQVDLPDLAAFRLDHDRSRRIEGAKRPGKIGFEPLLGRLSAGHLAQ